MKSMLTAALSIVLLAGTSSFTPAPVKPVSEKKAPMQALVKVKLKFVNSDGSPFAGDASSFFLSGTNQKTGESYGYDYDQNAFFVPQGNYVFTGTDGSGAGNIGANSGQVFVAATTRTGTVVVMYVWAE